jgi:hypothetical protein
MMVRYRFCVSFAAVRQEAVIGSQNQQRRDTGVRDLAAYSEVQSPSSHFLVSLTFSFLVRVAFSPLTTPPFSHPLPLHLFFSAYLSSWVKRLEVSFMVGKIIRNLVNFICISLVK